MKIFIKYIISGIFFVISILILTNCQKFTHSQIQKTLVTSNQTTRIITNNPPLTSSYTSQPSLFPSKTVVPTSFSVPTSTFTPTPMHTWTQLPTLSITDAEVKIKDLLLNNAGCILPCWWGITPGKTTWNEASQFLNTLSDIKGPSIQDVGNVLYKAYSAYFNIDEMEYIISLISADDIVVEIGLLPDITIYGHQLNNLLTNNGEPKEIWLAPMPDTPGGSWFYLVLNYPDQGIMARYGGEATPIIKTDNEGKAMITGLHICPVGMGPELWLESPNKSTGVIGNPALGGGEFTKLLVPIQDITEMSLEDFYLTFRDADSSTCFDTTR